MDTQPHSHVRDASQLSRLIHLIYEAGVEPEKWHGVTAAIAQSFGTSKGRLFTPYVAPQHGGLSFRAGLSDEILQLWETRHSEHDIWSQRVDERKVRKTGEVVLDEQMVPLEKLLASPFYREFLCHIGIARMCTGFVFANDKPGVITTMLAVYRDFADPAFDQSDIEWMRLLVSHVACSFAGMWRLDNQVLKYTSAISSFDHLPFGVALLDAQMRVLHMNEAVKSAVERHDGIFINAAGHLDGTPATGSRQGLYQWLTSASARIGKKPARVPDCCLVPRRHGRGHYAIQCSAITPNSVWTNQHHDTCHVVFITNPGAQRLPTAERLMALYELTHSQAKVALAFANGDTYKHVARRLSISEETVRSHVKEIYPKTQVNRQVDLVRLVLSLAHNAI
jgi:DNA-binding CsgD family transcriptional regulator